MLRTLTLALVCCAPLAAGDKSWLAAAVERLDSERAAERNAATQAIRGHLKKELAPLLQAMRALDPEVSRRARKLLEALLPPELLLDQLELRGPTGELRVLLGQSAGHQLRPDELRALLDSMRRRVRKDLARRQAQVRRDEELLALLSRRLAQHRALARRDQGILEVLRKHDLSPKLLRFGVIGQRANITWTEGRRRISTDGYRVLLIVAGGAAARLGLRTSDVLLTINDTPVESPSSVVNALGEASSWSKLHMVVVRGNEPIDLKAQQGR